MKKIIILTTIIALISCAKQTIPTTTCDTFRTAIENMDSTYLANEINSLTTDLTPIQQPNDNLGHSDNLNTLINRLNNRCKYLTFSKVCYACIKTYPVQSEIKVLYDINDPTLYRIIDISTPRNGVLMHFDVLVHNTKTRRVLMRFRWLLSRVLMR